MHVRADQSKHAVAKTPQRKLGSRLYLLAASSLLPILVAPAANAQCAAVDANNQPVPLNGLTSNSTVTCTGTSTNEVLVDDPGADGIVVNINGGANVTGLLTSFNSTNNQINGVGGTIDTSFLGSSGAGAFVYLTNVNGTNTTIGVDGLNSTVLINGGTLSTQQITLAGDGNRFETGNGSVITAFGAVTGNGVITGGQGSNVYALGGSLEARNDGLLVTDSGGDDVYYINAGASFSAAGGARGRIVDLDGASDLLVVIGTHNLDLDITGIDSMSYIGSSTDSLNFNGIGNLQSLSVDEGQIGQINIAAMMAADGEIEIGDDGYVRYYAGIGAPVFSQSLSGTGVFELDGASLLITGDNSAFSGTLRLSSATFFGSNQNAAGTANIIINNNLLLGQVNLANQISGFGTVIMQGTGATSRSVLSGVNTYTGGTLITNAGSTLLLTNGSAAGTSTVTVGGDAFLELDFGAAGGDFANYITGQGALRKSGSGILTVSNGSNDYAGGTIIDGGILRVTDLSALGTGGIVTGEDGALMYDYVGAVSQVFSTPFMMGDGRFIKAGSGTIVISNSNTWTGGSQILAGRVGLNNGQGLGTGDIDIAQGAVLGIGGITLNNNVTGAGQIIKTANNVAVLTGTNTLTGGIVIQEGAIEVASGASLGLGPVDIQAGSGLYVANSADTTVAAQLTGAGALVKSGAGRAELTGANDLSNLVLIEAGTLAVSGTANIGTASVQVDNGATLEIARNGTAGSLDNQITGNGRVIKTGSSTITVTGANTYTGGTQIMAGALRVTDVSHLGTGAITVDAGAALDLNIAGNATFNHALSGAGFLRKSGAGNLQLLANGLSGLDITQGSVTVGTLSALGSGPIVTAGGATLIIDNATAQSGALALSGGGTLRKLGVGDLTLSNAFSIGTLLVDSGRVRLNGTMTGNAIVGAGGTLNGTGQVTGNLTNNGTVAPGNSIGTLNVQGNYVHNANSILEIEFDGAGNIDMLNVSGTAQLNGGTLRFVSLGGAEGSGGTFLTAGGGVSGTFATIETVGAQLPLSIVYQPTSTIMAPSILTARPSTFNSQALAASDTATGFIDLVSGKALRSSESNGAWVEAFTASGSRDAAGQTLAYDHASSGLSVGMHGPVADRLDAGFSVGWSQGDTTLGENGGSGDQDTMLASAFGRYRFDGVSIGGGVIYASIDQSNVRNVSFNSFAASISGETGSTVTGAFLSAGATFGSAGDWTFGGSATASYLSQTQDAYAETGSSPLRLELPELTFETLGLEAGVSASTSFDLAGSKATTRFDLGVRNTAAQDDRVFPVAFAATGASVNLQGDARDHTSPYAGASLDWALGGNANLTAGYIGRFGEDERHEARLGVNIAF